MRGRDKDDRKKQQATGEIHAFLGNGTEFEGRLKFEGAVRIDGEFRGEIQTPGTLVIGEGAHVEAEIECGNLVLNGELVGNVRATHRIEALSQARIRGNLQSPILVINEGVRLDGNVRMEMTEQSEISWENKIEFPGKSDKRTKADDVS